MITIKYIKKCINILGYTNLHTSSKDVLYYAPPLYDRLVCVLTKHGVLIWNQELFLWLSWYNIIPFLFYAA